MTLKLNGTNSVAAPAYAGDDADTGLQCGTNELKLVTGGSARATVDSSGNFGIGTTTPTSNSSTNLHVSSSGSGTNAQVRVTGNNATGLDIIQGGDSTGYVWLRDNNNLLFGTNDTERMRILSSGGLTFNGDTAQANALDDYEEGDWTPSFTSGGWTGGNLLSAKYVKIGAQVFVQMAIDSLTGTGSTQVLKIGSLPFNSITNGYAAGSADIGEGSVKGVYCRSQSNSNEIAFFYPSENNSAGRLQLKGNEIGDAYIIIGLTYFTNS